ncbi:hypothetical protein [Thermococcus henrietii]|uniref:hypothetical protein n=1 Tax=Thermococcus henrietii TaxID=2016361 RepID=UPI000C084D49|nr:hypothetical protein [Thermococcus henrietii]
MRHRLVLSILIILGFVFLLPVLEFGAIHGAVWPGGVYTVSQTEGSQFSSPGWAVLNLTCNGRTGRVLVMDDTMGRPILNATVFGHGNFEVVIPHAGDYSVFSMSNGTLVCTDRLWCPHPTERVQNVSYLASSTCFALSAFLLWRWWH